MCFVVHFIFHFARYLRTTKVLNLRFLFDFEGSWNIEALSRSMLFVMIFTTAPRVGCKLRASAHRKPRQVIARLRKAFRQGWKITGDLNARGAAGELRKWDKVEKDGGIKKDWNSRDMLWLLWFQSMAAKFTDHEITHGCKVSSFEDATMICLKQGSVAEHTLGLQLHHMFWILSHIDIKLYNRCSSLFCMCFFVSPSRFGIFSVLQMAAPGWSIQRRKTKVPDRFWSEHLFFKNVRSKWFHAKKQLI